MHAIPLCDLARRYHAHRAEYDDALRRFLDAQQFTLGAELEAFEREFASYVGIRHVVGVANGTDSLELALRAWGIGPGDEVISVAHTFIATVSAIRLAGAKPVLVDVDPVSHTMDPVALRHAITPRTKAVIPVHLYGRPAAMPEILEVAGAHGLRVLEDAAQAHGARLRDRMAGAWGDAASFSFYPTKNLGAMGDAGGVATDDDALAERLRALRHHGQRERHRHEVLGRNSRLDEVQAAVLRVGLWHLDAWNRRRRALAARYREALGDAVGVPSERRGEEHVYQLFVVEHPHRDRIRRALEDSGVGTGIHYPVPVHRQPTWEGPVPRLPVTEGLCPRILSLPMFPELRDDEVDLVAQVVRKAAA